jgi:hypothetical protein
MRGLSQSVSQSVSQRGGRQSEAGTVRRAVLTKSAMPYCAARLGSNQPVVLHLEQNNSSVGQQPARPALAAL